MAEAIEYKGSGRPVQKQALWVLLTTGPHSNLSFFRGFSQGPNTVKSLKQSDFQFTEFLMFRKFLHSTSQSQKKLTVLFIM